MLCNCFQNIFGTRNFVSARKSFSYDLLILKSVQNQNVFIFFLSKKTNKLFDGIKIDIRKNYIYIYIIMAEVITFLYSLPELY